MNDIEDLFVDVHEPWCYEETRRSIDLFPLFLPEELYLFFGGCFLLHILRIFLELVLNFIVHLLSL